MLCRSHPLTQRPGQANEGAGSVYTGPNQKCASRAKCTGHLSPNGTVHPHPQPDSEVAVNSWLWIFAPVESKAPFQSAFCPAVSASIPLLLSALGTCFHTIVLLLHLATRLLSHSLSGRPCLTRPISHTHTHAHAHTHTHTHTYDQFILLPPALCSPGPSLSSLAWDTIILLLLLIRLPFVKHLPWARHC